MERLVSGLVLAVRAAGPGGSSAPVGPAATEAPEATSLTGPHDQGYYIGRIGRRTASAFPGEEPEIDDEGGEVTVLAGERREEQWA